MPLSTTLPLARPALAKTESPPIYISAVITVLMTVFVVLAIRPLDLLATHTASETVAAAPVAEVDLLALARAKSPMYYVSGIELKGLDRGASAPTDGDPAPVAPGR